MMTAIKTIQIFYLTLSLLLTTTLAVAQTTVPLANYSILQKDEKTLARYRDDREPILSHVPLKSYVDELRTPSGKNVLRDAPHDHLHHHGLMFAIYVDGCNFWEEFDANAGRQIPTSQKSVTNKNSIERTYNWNGSESRTFLTETRSISVDADDNITLLDWHTTLQAESDTVLGHEGAGHYHGLGMRFAQEMDKAGCFFNDTGKHDGNIFRSDERLKRCRWMAYTAKLDGKPVTVTMFDHPSNPVPMTAFTMGDAGSGFAYMSATMNLHHVPVRLKAGQTFSVKYRIAVWDGEILPEVIEKACAEYVSGRINQ